MARWSKVGPSPGKGRLAVRRQSPPPTDRRLGSPRPWADTIERTTAIRVVAISGTGRRLTRVRLMKTAHTDIASPGRERSSIPAAAIVDAGVRARVRERPAVRVLGRAEG